MKSKFLRYGCFYIVGFISAVFLNLMIQPEHAQIENARGMNYIDRHTGARFMLNNSLKHDEPIRKRANHNSPMVNFKKNNN